MTGQKKYAIFGKYGTVPPFKNALLRVEEVLFSKLGRSPWQRLMLLQGEMGTMRYISTCTP